MLVFHTTDEADSILAHGFPEGMGFVWTGNEAFTYRGVWFADYIVDTSMEASANAYVAVDIPDDVLESYEWLHGDRTQYREFLMPCKVANRYPIVQWGDL